MSDAIVFDVAHGNCCLIRSKGACGVIDAPRKALLLNTLEDMGIACVDVAFISHADKDHIAGVIGLLSSQTIELKKPPNKRVELSGPPPNGRESALNSVMKSVRP